MSKEPQKEKPTEVENLNNEWKSLKIHTRDFGGPKFNMGFAWFGIINGKPFPDQTKVLEYILSQGRKFVSARTKNVFIIFYLHFPSVSGTTSSFSFLTSFGAGERIS